MTQPIEQPMIHTIDSPLVADKIDMYLDEVLPIRQCNYLGAHGITHVGEILQTRLVRIKCIRNWGTVCTSILFEGLTAMGLQRLWPAKRINKTSPRPILICKLGLFHVSSPVIIHDMEPCHVPPGTRTKLDILRERANKGQPLHIDDDTTLLNSSDEYERSPLQPPNCKWD